MSLTPQDNARVNYQTNPQHAFPRQPNVPTPSPSLQRANYVARQSNAGIRPQHTSPYSTPYTPNQQPTGPPRPIGNGNGNSLVSAEQQIAGGVLNNASAGSGSNTPQRRPPALGTSIHVPPHGTPQPMNINHAINPNLPANQGLNQGRDLSFQRQSQNGSPALQGIGGQRSSMNVSPITIANSLDARPLDQSPVDHSQDMSMIDPQLSLEQQIMNDPNGIMHDPDDSMMGVPPQVDDSQPEIEQGEMLSAPPAGNFPTFEALFGFAQAYALRHGYAFVIGRSKRDNRGLKKVFLICDRGGTNKEKVNGEARQRKTKSRKCGCEFGVFGLETKAAWMLRGRMDGEHLTHNHPPSESPTEHPGARKLDPKAIAAVKALEENGVSVKETLEILHKENEHVRYLPRDIYNARAAIKRDPSRVDATAMDRLPTFYKKPPLTFEEKLRAELRTEVDNAHKETAKVKEQWQAEVEELKAQLEQKNKMIAKFEEFIDICNERVMMQRERLADGDDGDGEGVPVSGSG